MQIYIKLAIIYYIINIKKEYKINSIIFNKSI